MGACGAASFVSFIFFKETFRTERSLAWQKARKLALEKAEAAQASDEQAANKPGLMARSFQSMEGTLGRLRNKLFTQQKSSEGQFTFQEKNKEHRTPFAPPLYHDAPQLVNRTTSAPNDSTAGVKTLSVTLDRSISARPALGKRPSLARRVTTTRSINRVVTIQGKDIKVNGRALDGITHSDPSLPVSSSGPLFPTSARWGLPLQSSSNHTT